VGFVSVNGLGDHIILEFLTLDAGMAAGRFYARHGNVVDQPYRLAQWKRAACPSASASMKVAQTAPMPMPGAQLTLFPIIRP